MTQAEARRIAKAMNDQGHPALAMGVGDGYAPYDEWQVVLRPSGRSFTNADDALTLIQSWGNATA